MDILEAVRGQPNVFRGVLKGVSPVNYRELPLHVSVMSGVIRQHAQATPDLEASLEALAASAQEFVAVVDDLGAEAHIGHPTFDAAGRVLADQLDRLESALSVAELRSGGPA